MKRIRQSMKWVIFQVSNCLFRVNQNILLGKRKNFVWKLEERRGKRKLVFCGNPD